MNREAGAVENVMPTSISPHVVRMIGNFRRAAEQHPIETCDAGSVIRLIHEIERLDALLNTPGGKLPKATALLDSVVQRMHEARAIHDKATLDTAVAARIIRNVEPL